MKFRTVVLAHGGGESAPRDGRRAACGAALGHLDDGHARVRAFESGHGAGRAAADDQHVGVGSERREYRCRKGRWDHVILLIGSLAI